MKDTNNIETYNIWSGTDYTENTTNFTKGTGIQLNNSKEWSSNGESSLKIERIADSSYHCDTSHLSNVNAGETLTYSCIVYSPNIKVNVRLRGNGEDLASVSVPVSTKPILISLSASVPEDYGYMCLRFLPTSRDSLFVDNISAMIS